MRLLSLYSLVILTLISSLNVQAQSEVRGEVKNSITASPVVGANVFNPKTNTGTSTDTRGNFVLKFAQDENANIRISHIGYRDTLVNIPEYPSGKLLILLEPDSVEIASLVVTATRSSRPVEDIPQRIEKIHREDIEAFPATNTDDLLKMIPGVNVNRSWGIFSRNASVTMRGMPGSARSLILLDGVPLNKTAGGTVNWHLITPEEVERIEVVKGPGSSLYGNNAMGGIINIITKKPGNKLQGLFNMGMGTYKTLKSQFNLSGNQLKENRGFYWKAGGFYRQGQGYILEPEETRDSLDLEAGLNEVNFNALAGYHFSNTHKLEIDYRYYRDKRGTGVKVFEEEGSYESFTENNFRLGYNRWLGQTRLQLSGFYFDEGYKRQSENINKSGEYKLTDTRTDKKDMGIWMTLTRAMGNRHKLSTGIDLKNGILDNEEIYRTSTDELFTDGKLLFSGIFLQDELDLARNKLKLLAGIRLDYAQFYQGHLKVLNPSSKTGFPAPVDEAFPESDWIKLSPKLSAKYFFTKHFDMFISASSGFMPPKLDDLAGSRKIRRGFKIANPNLKPETLNSLEVGFDYSHRSKLSIKPSVYYSMGHDFQYLVATGDFVDSGSDEPVPVYQRQNVTKVEVRGAELGIEYRPVKAVKLTGSYAYNHSKIIEYNSTGDISLDGKFLNEVPENLLFLGISWKNKIINVFADFTFTDDQWYDEENTVIIDGYTLVNFRLSRMIRKNIQLSLDVQDLFDDQFIDRKGYLSPGRFVMLEMKYFINK